MKNLIKLGAVAKINPDSITNDYPYDEIEYIDISSVGSGFLKGTSKFSVDEAPSRAKRIVKDGDTILSTVRPNRRSFFFVKNPKENTIVSTGFAVLRPTEIIDKRFLYYSITYQPFTDYLAASAKGAAYPAVDTSIISEAKIHIFSLNTQRKIASILSAYDDLIENNTRRIQILEEMAQRIYREWFVHFRFPEHENVKMVDSELGKIPEGWGIFPIGKLLSFDIGGGWGKEEQIDNYNVPAYVIRGTDIPPARHGAIQTCPLRYHKQSNFTTRKLLDGDIIFEVSGGSKDQPLGRSLFVSQKLLNQFSEDVICASFCKLMRPDKNIALPEILYLHLLEIYENRKIMKYQVQSTGISNFKFSIFLTDHKLIIPCKEIREQFFKIIEPLFDLIQILGIKNSNLRKSRDLLLPKLISGKIDVSDFDIDIGATDV